MESGYELLKSEPHLKAETPRSRRKAYGLIAASVFTLSCLSLLCFKSGPISRDEARPSSSKEIPQCTSALPLAASPPAPINLWAPLKIAEAVQIWHWLESPEQALNLTTDALALPNDNMIYNIEIYRPAKADALAYLSAPSSITAPERYARVSIHHGGRLKPVVMDYLVGPLPIGKNTAMRQLTEIFHRDDIPYNARGFSLTSELQITMKRIIPQFDEAIQDLFGVSVANNTLTVGAGGPFGYSGEFRRSWVSWRWNTGGQWLQPIGLFMYLDFSGTDMSQWKLLKIVYNHQIFNDAESFLLAVRNGTIKRLPPRPDNGADPSWSTRKRVGPQRDLDHLPGPRSVSFAGLRYRVDREQQYISWMGWGLYLGFDRDMGMSLWDVRMRGERIAYEISPQEAMAQYAGNDPIQSTTAWLDRFFGMGEAVRDMLPGYDCPHEATYLPATTHGSFGSITRERAICIFEQDTGRPLTRHTGYSEGEFGAAKGYVLTIRSISTVGNYDYLFDYILHLDGTIEVRVSASGYLQGAFWEPEQKGYGTQIRDTTMGSVHDHVINFKVDLDVAGTDNSLLHTSTSQETVTQPWFDDDWGQEVLQQKITREYITNEDDAKMKYPVNFQGGYAIVNQDKLNKWSNPRGYSIHPGFSPVHNTVVGSKRLENNANWARYNLAVSVRKDNEPSSSSKWNANLPGAPPVDFHKFFDGESMNQTDLVVWINVGTHHLPAAEDAPNTRTNTATSSFFLTPLNYFDRDISIDSTNAILLSVPKNPGGPFTFDDYGVTPAVCVPEAPAPFEYFTPMLHDRAGNLAPPSGAEEMRQLAEMYHRIPIES